MIAYWLWLSWMVSGFAALVVIFGWLGRRLIRQANPFPEDITLLFRPLDWEAVKDAFDFKIAQEELQSAPGSLSRRSLEFRIAVSREYLWRMEHNAWVVEQCARADQRDNLAVDADHERERQSIVAEAKAMLEGAAILERDSQLPNYAAQAESLRAEAAVLRMEAEVLHALIERNSKEDAVLPARTAEALQAATEFRAEVRPYLYKVNLLYLMLRLDKFRLLSTAWSLKLWHRGSGDVLVHYDAARVKAIAYLSLYHEDPSLSFI